MRTFMYRSIQTAGQQEVPNKAYQLGVLSLGLSTAPQLFNHLGHTVAGYLHRLGISRIPQLNNRLMLHPDGQVLPYHQSQRSNTLDLVGFILNKEV